MSRFPGWLYETRRKAGKSAEKTATTNIPTTVTLTNLSKMATTPQKKKKDGKAHNQ